MPSVSPSPEADPASSAPAPAAAAVSVPFREHPTFRVALAVLGVVVVVELGAAGWALASRLEFAPDRSRLVEVPAAEGSGPVAPAPAPAPAVAPVGDGQAGLVPAAEPSPVPSPPPVSEGVAAASLPAAADAPPSPSPWESALGVGDPVGLASGGTLGATPVAIGAYDPTAILDTGAAEAVRDGNALRESGDTQAALVRYTEALDILPGHPRILYEIATTYEAMGIAERAAKTWEKIYRLGESAGDLFFIADSKLRGSDGVAATSAARPFAIRSVAVARDGAVVDGERVTLDIAVAADGAAEIDPSLFEAHVLFYDLVDGLRVDQTTADPPQIAWSSGPVIDWAEPDGASGLPEERLEVVYFHPEMTLEEKARYGSREYYGYVIRIYYDGQLVDRAAEPLTLLERLFDRPPAERPNPRLDNGLFPNR